MFRVEGSGFRVQGSGLRVKGIGLSSHEWRRRVRRGRVGGGGSSGEAWCVGMRVPSASRLPFRIFY